jgi:hypothetical protein
MRDVLLPALAPCSHLEGNCKNYCRWEADKGHIPRGFGGGMASPDDIRLILVTAEPGDPADGDCYSGSPSDMLSSTVAAFYEYMLADSLRREGRGSPPSIGTYGTF